MSKDLFRKTKKDEHPQSEEDLKKAVTKIQSLWKGYYLRKYIKKPQDNFTYEMMYEDLIEHIRHDKYIEHRNNTLGEDHKKWRRDNFPSSISENICKLGFIKKYKFFPTWNSPKGDLQLKIPFLQIEVKGFMSDGPLSFGPTEDWDFIYFVDCKDFINKIFKIYEIRLSNKSDEWRNIIISGEQFNTKDIPNIPNNLKEFNVNQLKELCKKRGITQSGTKNDLIQKLVNEAPGSKFKKPETFGEIADKNQRGKLRACFYSTFKKQLGEHCKLIFDGHISELDYTN